MLCPGEGGAEKENDITLFGSLTIASIDRASESRNPGDPYPAGIFRKVRDWRQWPQPRFCSYFSLAYFAWSRARRASEYRRMAACRLATPSGSASSGGSESMTCWKAASKPRRASGYGMM